MIDREHKLPVTAQCQLLQLPRSSAYYRNEPVRPADLALMRRIDELHLERWSCYRTSAKAVIRAAG